MQSRPVGRVTGSVGAALLLLFGAGCGKPRAIDQPPPQGVGCHAGDAYDIVPLEAEGSASWFGATDDTGWRVLDAGNDASVKLQVAPLTAVATVGVQTIENGGHCGRTQAMVLEASGNKDWGGFWGYWASGGKITSGQDAGLDASQFEGVAFWGRSHGVDADGMPFPTDPGFTMELSDRHTTDFVSVNAGDPDASDICIPVDASSAGVVIDPTTQLPISVGGTANERACGNYFTRPVVLTSDWQLYLLPFSSYHQTRAPSLRPGGLDTSGIFLINIRPVKEAVAEFWFHDFGWYRKKTDATGDAGLDVSSGPPPPVDTGVDSPSPDTGTDAETDADITDASSD